MHIYQAKSTLTSQFYIILHAEFDFHGFEPYFIEKTRKIKILRNPKNPSIGGLSDPCENFTNENLDRNHRFCQKIMKIGAILATFKLLEGLKFACHLLANSASRQGIYANLIKIAANPGTIR